MLLVILMQDVTSVDATQGDGRKVARREANKGAVRNPFNRCVINALPCEWDGGATCWASGLQSKACRFNSQLGGPPFPQIDIIRARRENYQVCSVQYCVQQLCTVQCTHTYEQT